MKELAKEHICTKNSVVIARGKGPGGSLEVGRGGGKRDIGNSVNNKNKEKKKTKESLEASQVSLH